MRETIFALATAPGRAAVAVVRLSGPRTAGVLRVLAGSLPPARRASLRRLVGRDGQALDSALTLWLPGPHSYTGEDAAELHLHGGPAVVARVTEALAAEGLRLAAPGEFTRRAFEAGKLDLDQAEAVADLVEAETEAQARQAVAQLEGALGRRYREWRGLIAEALAYVEAAVDFPDEELPQDVAARAGPLMRRLEAELALALADGARGERVRDGFRIALVGAPNAGKSRLFNALLGRDAAIVTASPGTTRDIIEAALPLGGYKVVLADMAGLRDADDEIEAEGVRRARAWAEAADLRIWVADAAAGDGAWREGRALARRGDLLVLNKCDLEAGCDASAARASAAGLGLETFSLSATGGEGVEGLRTRLMLRVVDALGGRDFPAVTRQRHARLLETALEHVRRVGGAALEEPELAAEDLRLAARALERVTGRIGAEDVLDVIFGSFCIGK
jgi:tRNA modification GTPase